MLPAFRVYYNDGSSYVTSMASGITLEQARDYFIGQRHAQNEKETKFLTVARVEQIK